MRRRLSSLLVGATLLLLVSACGTESVPPWLVRHYLGVPPGVSDTFRDDVVWTSAGRMAVVTYGSSGCPKLPVRLDVLASDRLNLTVEALSSGPCTADLAATTSVIEVPKTLDVILGVTVTVLDGRYGATVSLPPETGAGARQDAAVPSGEP